MKNLIFIIASPMARDTTPGRSSKGYKHQKIFNRVLNNLTSICPPPRRTLTILSAAAMSMIACVPDRSPLFRESDLNAPNYFSKIVTGVEYHKLSDMLECTDRDCGHMYFEYDSPQGRIQSVLIRLFSMVYVISENLVYMAYVE
jgi:hypothetical protein